MASLPMINLSVKDLTSPRSSSWETRAGEITCALEEYGCFKVEYDGVSSDLHDAIFAAAQKVLDLPHEVKIQNTSGAAGHGYVGRVGRFAGFERLSIEKASTKEGVETFTKLMWPSGNDTFCETATKFVKAAAELQQIVMTMVAKTYGVEQHYESLLGSKNYTMNFNRYKKLGGEETAIGLPPHTDKSFLTVIHQKEQGRGIEVRTKDDKWIEVELSPSNFFVMAGDGLMGWTNGRIEAPFHKVMTQAKVDRYAMILMSYIRDREIQAPQELVDEDHPVQFKPFEHYKYINFKSFGNEKKLHHHLKVYCGV